MKAIDLLRRQPGVTSLLFPLGYCATGAEYYSLSAYVPVSVCRSRSIGSTGTRKLRCFCV